MGKKAETVKALRDRIKKADPLAWLLDHRDAVIRAYTDAGPKRAYHDIAQRFPDFRSVYKSENTFKVHVRVMTDVVARLESDRRAKMAIIGAAKRVQPQWRQMGVASISEIRAALDLDKTVFDRAVISLAMAERIFLHSHAHPAQLTPEELARMVADGEGRYYVGLVIKQHGQSTTDREIMDGQSRQIESLLADLEGNAKVIKIQNQSIEDAHKRIERLEKAHAAALGEVDRLTRELDRLRAGKSAAALATVATINVIPKNISGWTVGADKKGRYRLHRKIKNKGYSIYAGKAPLDIPALKKKIAAKERTIC